MKTRINLPILVVTLLFLGLSVNLAKAQPAALGLPAQDVKYKEFEQHGNLFDLKIIPGSKETRLYLVGKEAASVKFEKLSIVGKIKVGNNEKLIEFRKDKDYFTTKDILHGQTLHLKAKDDESQKSEEFQVDLKKP